jgi:hypothetical protein
MMIDENLARLHTYRNNVRRYRSFLKSELTELERQFIERRLCEEQAEIKKLSAAGLPLVLEHSERVAKAPLGPMNSRGAAYSVRSALNHSAERPAGAGSATIDARIVVPDH